MQLTPEFLKLAEELKDLDYTGDKFQKLINNPKNIAKLRTIIKAKGFYDLEFFAKYFFSDVYIEQGNLVRKGHTSQPFNKMHKKFFKEFNPHKRNIRKCILASRGSAKTTLVALIYVMHGICYGYENYILLLSAGADLANMKTKDIHFEVRNNEKLKKVFNLKFEGNRNASTQTFVILGDHADCKIHSQSFFSIIRGTKYKHHRITLCILDDVVHGEGVFSEDQRIKADRQFKTDLLNAIEPGTNIIYIGTRIHNKDLGSELSKDASWDSEEWPAFEKWPDRMDLWEQWEDIRRNPTKTSQVKEKEAQQFYEDNKAEMEKGAKVLWPEREPTLELMKQRMLVGRREFDAEKQMVAFLTGDSIFNNITWFYPTTENGQHGFFFPKYNKFVDYDESRFVKYYALDPATGERKKQTATKTHSQSARIIACKDTETGNIYVLDCYMDRKPQSKIIYEMYDLHHHHNFHRMGLEENLYRDLYKEHIKLIQEKWHEQHKVDLTLPIVSIWNDIDKEERIYSLEPRVTMGKIVFNQHMNPDFVAQIKTYPNSDHNDGLDALEILWHVCSHEHGFIATKIGA